MRTWLKAFCRSEIGASMCISSAKRRLWEMREQSWQIGNSSAEKTVFSIFYADNLVDASFSELLAFHSTHSGALSWRCSDRCSG